jgi:RNA recognition motif-containing protein
LNSDGRPRGICHVEYAAKESAVAALESASQEPIHMLGRDLRLDYSAGPRAQTPNEPSEKLYFAGCAGDEGEIRNIFKQFSNSIVDIHLCMLFTLSESVPITHIDE